MANFLHTAPACELTPEVKKVGQVARGEPRLLLYQRCKTHEANVCRCGWEFGNHPVNQK